MGLLKPLVYNRDFYVAGIDGCHGSWDDLFRRVANTRTSNRRSLWGSVQVKEVGSKMDIKIIDFIFFVVAYL